MLYYALTAENVTSDSLARSIEDRLSLHGTLLLARTDLDTGHAAYLLEARLPVLPHLVHPALKIVDGPQPEEARAARDAAFAPAIIAVLAPVAHA